MPNEVDNYPIIDVDAAFFTLIPSRFPPVDLFERIAAGRDDEVAEVENLTNPRIRAKERLSKSSLHVVDDEPARFHSWNLAPFTYPNPEGSALFSNSVPCLEMSGDVQTALAVSVEKRELFLQRTKEDPIGLDMRMLRRKVKGRFLNARSPTSPRNRWELRELGEKVIQMNTNVQFDGVLFHSSERPTGTRIVVLNGDALERPIQCEHYRFHWNGERIAGIYNFDNSVPTLQNSIDPAALKDERDLFAA